MSMGASMDIMTNWCCLRAKSSILFLEMIYYLSKGENNYVLYW